MLYRPAVGAAHEYGQECDVGNGCLQHVIGLTGRAERAGGLWNVTHRRTETVKPGLIVRGSTSRGRAGRLALG
jgi:hypothetical protein